MAAKWVQQGPYLFQFEGKYSCEKWHNNECYPLTCTGITLKRKNKVVHAYKKSVSIVSCLWEEGFRPSRYEGSFK